MQNDLLSYLEGYLTEKRIQTFHKVLNERTKHFTVVLEDTYQPHNSSAVIRSCDIFGIQDVYTIENEFTSKISKHVARGAHKWIDLHRFKKDIDNTLPCFEALREKDYQIIATSPHIDSTMLHDFDITKKTAFVFGREKEGISDVVKAKADGFLKIPMYGFTESLNISVAVAIILQDVTTRLKRSNLNWSLSEAEKAEIYFRWVKKSVKNVDKVIDYFHNHINETQN